MKPVTPPPDPSSLQWSALPRGRFTGLDWNDRAQREGADPYLIWAETVGLSTQRRSPGHAGPQRLSLLIELAPDCSPLQLQAAAGECLRIPDLYTRPTGPLQAALRYCTAEASPAFFARSQGDLAPLLRRYELSMARGTPDGAARVAKRPPCASGPDSAPGLSGKVLGVIDGGLAFAHPRFRAPAAQGGGTRVAYFWCQDPLPQQAPPPGLHYGSEITAEEINAAVQASVQHGQDDEAQVYRQFGMGLAMDKRVNHGTHVLDIAAGPRTVSASVAGLNERQTWEPLAPPSWRLADDEASRCPIVAVQLDHATVQDTSGGSMRVHLLDGLMYILSCCDAEAEVVVNLSWGTLAGPHDGSSLLERAMDQLVALWPGTLTLVLPTSNAYQGRTHGNAPVLPGQTLSLGWRCVPGDPTQNFLELWLPAAAAPHLELTLQVPGLGSLPPLRVGDAGVWRNASGQALAMLSFPQRNARGEPDCCALLALAPCFSLQPGVATSPAGLWTLSLHNRGDAAFTFDAYVERDDVLLGRRGGPTQSRLEDPDYDVEKTLDTRPFQARPWLRRSGTFNSIATGARVISVGGTRLQASDAERWAPYSAPVDDPDRLRASRSPLIVKAPHTLAPSDENPVLHGLRAAGTRAGSTVRLVGTSAAAPQIARLALNRVRRHPG
ncbi:hypothetical protein PSQ40_03340 [Curvibacter sp. HBC61]|uniref:Peptidase S8/S53 domain-containing protein n=1 Tax=Curvibacter cyanobacteriorum TaxID=3026422 RepID=A0ABT5MU85_9BURK|nr:hypothetical protein [Curvibacter sp. HBC61]MDD0837600.1 hypothetical protein [Curvibacter sp. HBC61]